MRIEIIFPEKIHFTTNIHVRITDLNYGNHLGNDRILSYAHEARVQFLKHYGYEEFDVEGAGLIMADAAIQFKSEAFYGEELTIEIAVAAISRVSFELYYRIKNSERLVAIAKTGMVFFDYNTRKIVSCPVAFKTKFAS
jgi:acyl-CoA thioester hydrolase